MMTPDERSKWARTVPLPPLDCTGCTACCDRELLILHPEMGDDPSQYDTMQVTVGDQSVTALRVDDDHGCVYCDHGTGCTIYDRRPALCKEFDCRRSVLSIPRAELDEYMRRGMFSRSMVKAGRDRLRRIMATLPRPPA